MLKILIGKFVVHVKSKFVQELCNYMYVQSIQNRPSKFCANIVNLLKYDNTVINLCGYVNVIVLYTNLTVVPGNLSITLSVHKSPKIGCVYHEIRILKLQFCNLSDFKNTVI